MTDKFTFRTSDELGKMIKDEAESKNENVSKALNHILEKHFDMENQYETLDDPCPLLFYLGEHEAPLKVGKGWYCLQRSPKSELLGSGIIEAAKKFCTACKTRDEAIADSKTLRKQKQKGITVLIHSCKKGAKTNEDMTEMYCPEVGKWRPIMKRKKKTDYVPCRDRGTNKARCMYLVSTQTVIKGNLPIEGQNL